MPFQMRDETAGFDVLYIDNAGQVGLGSLPNSGAGVTVKGNSLLSPAGAFIAAGIASPGTALAASGSVSVPASSSSSVSFAYIQTPTVTSTSDASGITTTSVTWVNTTAISLTVTYNLW